jgi:anti-sigma regulatory factor (Ser/Thr protein kinase)
MGLDQPERLELELPVDARAPAQARAAVDRVTARVPGDIGFRARVAISELVANSVTHAPDAEGTIRIRVIRMPSLLRVEVHDGGAPFDSGARVVSTKATSGRGLQLVDALVDRWGVVHERGNRIWFEIDQHTGGGHDGPRPGRGDVHAIEPSARQSGSAERHTRLGAMVLGRAAHHVREGWCQDDDAIDLQGRPVQPWDERASAWSLLGAIVAALDGPAGGGSELPPGALAAAMTAIAELIEETSLAGWNDAPTRTQNEVIDVLERARMLLRSGNVRS